MQNPLKRIKIRYIKRKRFFSLYLKRSVLKAALTALITFLSSLAASLQLREVTVTVVVAAVLMAVCSFLSEVFK